MRVAVIGTGGVALRHLGVLAQMPSVTVIGHVSSDLARAEAQAGQWGGRAYPSVPVMLEHERPDAVWICVTPDRHGPPERALLEARVPFFVEKPLSVDLATASEISDAVARAGVVTAVGYKFRALDTLPRLRSLLEETPARMVIGAWHDAMPPPLWWRQSRRSGGQLVEQATHLVDLARYLHPSSVSILGAASSRWPRPAVPDSDVADVTAALLRFGDVPATFTATSLLPQRTAIHLQLVCEGRLLTLTERELLIQSATGTDVFAAVVDPFLEEDRIFLEAVRGANPNAVLSTYADALETHRLCVAIRDLASP